MHNPGQTAPPYRHLTIMAAHGLDLAVGQSGRLPWVLDGHIDRFAWRLENSSCIAVGHRTALVYANLLQALPCRAYAISREPAAVSGLPALPSIAKLAEREAGDILVVGGAGLFAEALPHATFLDLTIVDAESGEADAYFPRWNPDEWQTLLRQRSEASPYEPNSSTRLFLARRIGEDDTAALRASRCCDSEFMPSTRIGH